MVKEDIIIIGGGPCGLAAALSLMKKGYDPLVIEKDNVVSSIYRYPTHQTFFSSSEKLEIGEVPFSTVERKPRRNEALVYYRNVVKRKKIRVQRFEKVKKVTKHGTSFGVETNKCNYEARFVIIATGYYDNPNLLGVKGEELEHVFHYFKEAHPFFDTDVVVIGGKNSAVDATLELEKAGARVTVLYRGTEFSKSIKPWILPEFQSLIHHRQIDMVMGAEIIEITNENVLYTVLNEQKSVKADFVFAMTGYHPDHSFLTRIGVTVDEDTGRPSFHPETMETNVTGLFIAGVIAAGNDANEIFIENGRFHGDLIARTIKNYDT